MIASERFDDALNALQSLLKSNPNDQFVYFTLGETILKSYINDPYSDSKKDVIKKANIYFNLGIKTDSLNPLNYVGKGIMELYDKC